VVCDALIYQTALMLNTERCKGSIWLQSIGNRYSRFPFSDGNGHGAL